MADKNIIILKKIKKHAKSATEYTKELSFEEFLKDKKTLEASVFNISQIGELVKSLDKVLMEKYDNVYWFGIRGLRNRIVHDYDGIQFDYIWITIKKNLPQLIKDINLIIKKEKQ